MLPLYAFRNAEIAVIRKIWLPRNILPIAIGFKWKLIRLIAGYWFQFVVIVENKK